VTFWKKEGLNTEEALPAISIQTPVCCKQYIFASETGQTRVLKRCSAYVKTLDGGKDYSETSIACDPSITEDPEAKPKAIPEAIPEAKPKAITEAIPEAKPKAISKAIPEAKPKAIQGATQNANTPPIADIHVNQPTGETLQSLRSAQDIEECIMNITVDGVKTIDYSFIAYNNDW
jgi:hypothetical protein